MKCPFCQTEMELGYIYGALGEPAFWLPETVDITYDLAWITVKYVESRNGFFLDEIMKHTLFRSKEKPDSYYCEACHALIILLRTQGEDTEPQGDSHTS